MQVLCCNICSLPLHAVSEHNCSELFNTLCTKNYVQFLVFFTHAAELPRITSHPPEQKDAVPGKPVTFSIQVTGTEPLKYQWQHKTGEESGEWQSCDVESFPGTNSSTLTILSVQKSNEGSYCCTVSNCAGSETSECARLTVGELNCMHGV